MTLIQLEALLKAGDLDKCIEILDTYCLCNDLKEAIKEYNPETHRVHDRSYRPDKPTFNDKGESSTPIPVARLSLPFQKRIVNMAVAFLGTPTNQATPEGDLQENFLKIINKIYSGNKLDYKFSDEVKTTMSEKQCAELWYTRDAEKDYWSEYDFHTTVKPSPMVLSKTNGDTLYPLYDQFDDMIAFARGYKVTTLIDNKVEEVEHFDIYTAEWVYQAQKSKQGWLFRSIISTDLNGTPVTDYTADFGKISNPVGKIPVLYVKGEIEWKDVQCLIERLEKKISNHGDTNDYFDSPVAVATGNVMSTANKNESGKLFEIEDKDGDLKYLTWDNAPASMKMEMDNLLRFIYSFTSTPDISFEQMKGIGEATSGTALSMLFMDAHLKASDHEKTYGLFVQRRNNYLKQLVVTLDKRYQKAMVLEITPKFTYFLPKNVPEQLAAISSALTAGIMSKETGIEQNPLLSDPEAEKIRIDDEKAEAIPEDPILPLPLPKPVPKPAA